ncbi:MAG: hypothetical protein WBI41_01565 [Azovibrio sp.]|uniref:hypothetical protein n=1 Tax=Azovibrio sp. TaxID=1872673 RepID=UPI003C75068E
MPIGEQEKALRQNPLGAGSDLLKKYPVPFDPSYFSTLVFSCGFLRFPVLSGAFRECFPQGGGASGRQ